MKAKTFVWAVLAAVLGVLGALALVLALTDPFFVVRGLDEEDTALFSNQRYEMAGLIRNQDYSAVVMGTSLVALLVYRRAGEGDAENHLPRRMAV